MGEASFFLGERTRLSGQRDSNAYARTVVSSTTKAAAHLGEYARYLRGSPGRG